MYKSQLLVGIEGIVDALFCAAAQSSVDQCVDVADEACDLVVVKGCGVMELGSLTDVEADVDSVENEGVEVRVQVFARDGLAPGYHDLTVRVLGDARPEAEHCWVSIDGAAVDYSEVDEQNQCFARLQNLLLAPDVSCGRDTTGHNATVEQRVRSGRR